MLNNKTALTGGFKVLQALENGGQIPIMHDRKDPVALAAPVQFDHRRWGHGSGSAGMSLEEGLGIGVTEAWRMRNLGLLKQAALSEFARMGKPRTIVRKDLRTIPCGRLIK